MPTFLQSLQRKLLKSAHRINQQENDSLFFMLFNTVLQLVATLSIIQYDRIFSHPQSKDTIVAIFSVLNHYIYMSEESYLDQIQDGLYIDYAIIAAILLLELVFIYSSFFAKDTETNAIIIDASKCIKFLLTLPLFGFQMGTLKESILNGSVPLIVLCGLALAISTCSEWIVLELGCTCLYKEYKRTGKSYNSLITKQQLVKKSILTYVIFRADYTQIEAIIMSFILLSFSAYALLKGILQIITYYNEIYEIIHYQAHIFTTCFLFLVIIQIGVDLVAQNLLMVTLSSYFWFLWAYRNALMFVKYQLLIKDPYDITKQAEAIAYLHLFYMAYHNRKDDQNSMMIAGIVKDHIDKCEDTQCYCKCKDKEMEMERYNVKDKDKATFRLKLKTEKKIKKPKRSQFQLNFIRMFADYFQSKFETTDIMIAVLSFKIQILKEFPRFFYESKNFFKSQENQSHSNIHYQYMIFELQTCAREHMKSQYQDCDEVKNTEVFVQQKNIQHIYNDIIVFTNNLSALFRYNSKSMCNLNILQQQLSSNFAIMVNIQLKLEELKNEISMSVEILQIFLFYSKIILNLNENVEFIRDKLLWIYKRMEFKDTNLTYFNVNLFSEKGCVLESYVDLKSIGVIANASKNAPTIFQYPIEQMLESEVGKLLPMSVRDEHSKLMLKWISSGESRMINNLKETYCVTSKKCLIQVLLKLQISVVLNTDLKFSVGITQKNTEDYMIINQNHEIEGIGTRFYQFFPEEFQFFNAEDVFPDWIIFKNEIKFEPIIIKTEIKLKAKKSAMMSTGAQAVFMIEIQIFKEVIGKAEVIIVKYLSIHEKRDRSGEVSNTNILSSSCLNMLNNLVSAKNLEGNKEKDENDLKKLYLQNQSSTESSGNTSEFSVKRLIGLIATKAFKGEKIEYPKLRITTIILWITYILIVITIIALLYFYAMGLGSYNEVVFADGAVSDNMQLLQFLYNKITMFYQYCGQDYSQQRCQFVKKSSQQIETYLYGLLANNILSLVENKTFLGHPYFFYEFTPIKMILRNTTEIDTFQFMEYFVHASKKINSIVEKEGRVNQQANQIYKILQQNWPEMKRINHLNLQQYELLGIKELKIVEFYVIVMTTFCILFSTIYVMTMLRFYQSKEQFSKKFLFLYRLIPVKTNDSLSTYYSNIRESLSDLPEKDHGLSAQNISNLYEQYYEQLHANKQNKSTKNDLSHYSFTFTVSYKIRIFLFLFWAIMISVISVIASNMISVFPTCKKMLADINELMDSENYLIQNFYELKVYYLSGLDSNSDQYAAFQKDVFKSLHQDQTSFAKTALEANNVFIADDPKFRNEFASIISDNICTLTQSVFKEWEVKKCFEEMHYKIMEEGLISTMTYFQRIVFEAFFDLKNKKNSVDPNVYFKRSIFEDLDDYIFYMFRLYQSTQARMNVGLTNTINNRVILLGIIVSVDALLMTATLVHWIVNSRKKRQELAETYGYMLMYPVEIIREIKIVQQTLIKSV